jgi:flagellum-specific peptidoglycan hydrolase FlgJ
MGGGLLLRKDRSRKMSLILFANPFATQTAPQPSPPSQPQDIGAIAATGGPSQTGSTSDASSNSGNGSGQSNTSNQQNNAALVISRAQSSAARTQDATSKSVFNAQTQAPWQANVQIEPRAWRSALALMQTAPNDAFLTRISTPAEPLAASSGLPKVGMPDPLPTSPYLKPSTPE